MCGRIALFSEPERLARILDAELASGATEGRGPRWNVAPTTEIFGVAELPFGEPDQAVAPRRVLDRYKWGLIPPWAKDVAMGGRMFNARGETVATKPSFRRAFASQRLLVPVDGFFEWHTDGDGKKQPHFFTRQDGALLVLAGLWEQKYVHSPQTDHAQDQPEHEAQSILSCTIITTAAGPDMDGIHDRMPAVLEPGSFDAWLDPANDDRPELEALLGAMPPGTLTHFAVDTRVGNTRNNDPSLVEPVD